MDNFLSGEDFAGKKAGMSTDDLAKILNEETYHPVWRPDADKACDYYDGNQISPEMAAVHEKRKQPLFVHNLIAPNLDGVLGSEAKSRTDWLVQADNDEFTDLAEVYNVELHEASRMTNSDRAVGDAYAGQIKCGMDWIEVGRNTDPFKYKYRVNRIHRNEMSFDWNAKSPILEDARWLKRERFLEADELKLAFPEHEELIGYLAGGWGMGSSMSGLNASDSLLGAYSDYQNSSIDQTDWYDSAKRQVKVYEIYYRVFERKPVLVTSQGDAVVFDASNPLHQTLIAKGLCEVSDMPFSSIRMAFFLGPNRVIDVPSPHPHNYFPYVPFFGFREDRSRIPYGLIRRMIPAQDEINIRRSKLTALLNKYRVEMEHDALQDLTVPQMLEELGRDDSVITLKKGKEFRVSQEFTLAQQQFSVLQDATAMIQSTGGIHDSYLGKETGATSGVAINSLVEQGSTTLGEINDNFRFAKQQVGNLLLANIIEDLGKKKDYEVKINAKVPGKAKKTIVLNSVTALEDGTEKISNRVLKGKTQVVLAPISSTAGYRAQQEQRMADLVSKMPEPMQIELMPFVFSHSDSPHAEEIIKALRKMSGEVPDTEDMSEQELQEFEQKQQQQQQQIEQEMAQQAAELERLQNLARKEGALADKAEREADSYQYDDEKTRADTQLILARMKETMTKAVSMRQELIDQVKTNSRAVGKNLSAPAINRQGY